MKNSSEFIFMIWKNHVICKNAVNIRNNFVYYDFDEEKNVTSNISFFRDYYNDNILGENNASN